MTRRFFFAQRVGISTSIFRRSAGMRVGCIHMGRNIMKLLHIWFGIAVAVIGLLGLQPAALAQNAGSSTAISGTVTDPSGAVVVPAQRSPFTIRSAGLSASATTDSSGNFTIPNVPFNPYHMTVTATGFAQYVQDVDVRSVVPLNLKISLQLAGATSTVTVEVGGRPHRK